MCSMRFRDYGIGPCADPRRDLHRYLIVDAGNLDQEPAPDANGRVISTVTWRCVFCKQTIVVGVTNTGRVGFRLEDGDD